MAEMKGLTELLCLEKVTNPAYSMLARLGFQHRGECACCGYHSLCYKTYRILSNDDQKAAVALLYVAIFAVVKKPGTDSGEEGVKQDQSGTSETSKNDKCGKTDYKNDSFTAGSTILLRLLTGNL